MGTTFAAMTMLVFLLVIVLVIACIVLGLHALLFGRMPGHWLQRHVRQPRLWGAGALLVTCGLFDHPSLLVIGIGLIALGHVVKSAS